MRAHHNRNVKKVPCFCLSSVLHDHRNGVVAYVWAHVCHSCHERTDNKTNAKKLNKIEHFSFLHSEYCVIFYFCVIHVCRSRTSAMSSVPAEHIFEKQVRIASLCTLHVLMLGIFLWSSDDHHRLVVHNSYFFFFARDFLRSFHFRQFSILHL